MLEARLRTGTEDYACVRIPSSSAVSGKTVAVDTEQDPIASCVPSVTSQPMIDLSTIQLPVLMNIDYNLLTVAMAEA